MGIRRRLSRLRLAAAFPIFFLGAQATADEWVGIGPPSPGRDVYSMALDPGSPSTIYASTFDYGGVRPATAPPTGSVLKSVNGGINWRLVVKILDGRATNGSFWVFYGSLTNVEFTLTVTATQTGTTKTYVNRQGQLASFADTRAF